MKQFSTQLLFILVFFTFALSCSQDNFETSQSASTDTPIQEPGYFKTSEPAAIARYLKTKSKARGKNPENSFVSYSIKNLHYEPLTNTDQEIAVIPATNKHSNVNSRILALTINDTLRSVVISLISENNFSSANFTGDVSITDLDGNIITEKKISSGLDTFYYQNPDHSTHTSLTKSLRSNECSGCPFSDCWYCQLEEVVITAPSQSSHRAPVTWLMLDTGIGGGSQGNSTDMGLSWDYGSDGGGGGGVRNCNVPGDLNGDCVVNDDDNYFWPYADCSSWEYSVQNGVRAAAVKGVKDSWVNMNNGKTRYTYAYFGIPLYFTMPINGLTNGRAATKTAKVVTQVGEDMDDWISANIEASDLQVEIKYYEMLQDGMKKIGGTVSRNNLYNVTINEPSQYKINLLNESNCD